MGLVDICGLPAAHSGRSRAGRAKWSFAHVEKFSRRRDTTCWHSPDLHIAHSDVLDWQS